MNTVGLEQLSSEAPFFFCARKIKVTMMKCLLVLGLLQGAAGQTTGAPTPSPTPSPPASAPATVTGQIGTSFGSCTNAKACLDNKQKCEDSAKAAMAGQTSGVTTNSFSSFVASRPANACRRLSETEIDKILSQADIRIEDPRRLSAANNGVVNFAYTITTTAGSMGSIQQAASSLGSSAAFQTALKTQLSNSGVPALATASASVTVTSVTATAAVTPTPAPTPTTPSVVSATVGSQVALSALAALVGFLW